MPTCYRYLIMWMENLHGRKKYCVVSHCSMAEINVKCYLMILLLLTPCLSVNVLPQQEKYLPDYSIYHNVSKLHLDLQSIIQKFPKYVRLNDHYLSMNRNSQLLIRLSNFTQQNDQKIENVKHTKIKMLLSYGEHAREFIPVESMIYLLKNITSGLSFSEGTAEHHFTQTVLSRFDIFIIGMANPDGRLHVEQTKNYCWRGTSTGVDLDRNFDWEFGEKGSSNNPKDEEFRGLYPFSEQETKIFTDLTDLHTFDVFVSFHSGTRTIFVPFSDTRSKEINRQPDNIDNMLELAHTIYESTNSKFRYGLTHTLTKYNADGTIFDYMAGVKKIPFSYTIELWGNDAHQGSSCFDLFNPRSEMVKETLQEVHPIYTTMFEYLIKWKNDLSAETFVQKDLQQQQHDEDSSWTFGYLLVFVVVFLFLYLITRYRCPINGRFSLHRRRIVSLKTLSSTFTGLSTSKTF